MTAETRAYLQALMDAPLEGRARTRAITLEPNAKPRKNPLPRGHAQPPGTGPAAETCGTCRRLRRIEHAKVYLKCGLNQDNWTGGRASDVRAGDAACRLWEAKTC